MSRRISRLEREAANKVVRRSEETLRKRKRKPRSDSKNPKFKHIEMIKLRVAIGLDKRTIAHEIGIGRTTMDRWIREYPEIRRAFEEGRSYRRRRAFKCFYEQAFPVDQEGRPTCKGNPVLMTWWMRVIEGRTENLTESKALERRKRGDVKAEENLPPIINYNLREPVEDDPEND